MANGQRGRAGEEGYLLIGVVVLIFLLLLTLSIAAPIVAKSLQRDREIESAHRGQQYVRGIQLYYKARGNAYPLSLDVLLTKTNNVRFMRKKYIDPLTGQDYRLIHIGEAKTTLKGFFGQSLGPAPGSLGANAGSVSTGSGFGGTSSFGGSNSGSSSG
jgi:type II secretory pathway pseudopilin PulG